MIRRDLRRQGKWLIPILALMAIAVAAGAYLAVHERLRTPLQDRYTVNVELASSESLTPGLGQPVNVAGVRVGDIADAHLRGGHAIVALSIDAHQLPRVFANAQASLHPNTPLKDMQIDLFPGGPPAHVLAHGATIPLAHTQVPLDAVDFTNALDADTRAYFGALVRDAQLGLHGRGQSLRRLLVALGPTAGQVRRISELLAARRDQVAQLVHNLALLATTTASRDRQLAQSVSSGDVTVHALADQDAALRRSITGLPPTLAAARSTLGHTTTFAHALGPTLAALSPAVRALPRALRAARPLLARAEPLVRTQLRPLVRQAQPLVAALSPAVHDLSSATPDLTSAFQVLTYVANELVYEPSNRQGYLFWLDWFAHNTDSMLSVEDAHGSTWRTLGLISCQSVAAQPQAAPLLEAITGVLPVCPPARKR